MWGKSEKTRPFFRCHVVIFFWIFTHLIMHLRSNFQWFYNTFMHFCIFYVFRTLLYAHFRSLHPSNRSGPNLDGLFHPIRKSRSLNLVPKYPFPSQLWLPIILWFYRSKVRFLPLPSYFLPTKSFFLQARPQKRINTVHLVRDAIHLKNIV